ncbi:MAG: capsular biosynthesis protein [Magnetococcales bacterium]|nr:capsular biosynthesis protein [Magnetococcales bacterium]
MAAEIAGPLKGLIDLHCHIVPGIDDGAGDLREALGMARMAAGMGTGTLVTTPHINPGAFNNTPESIAQAAEAFRIKLEEAGIKLDFGHAAEVRLGPWVNTMISQGNLPCYNQTGERRYFLLEFSNQGIDPADAFLVDNILRQGYHPIIAHPERNRSVRRDLNALAPFMKMGCLSQVTAGSLSGGFGSSVARTADALLERGWVHLLASDGHGFNQRQPVLSDGVRAAAQVVGFERAKKMALDTPRAILNGEPVS